MPGESRVEEIGKFFANRECSGLKVSRWSLKLYCTLFICILVLWNAVFIEIAKNCEEAMPAFFMALTAHKSLSNFEIDIYFVHLYL